MSYKQEMIKSLLESLETLEQGQQPPEEMAPRFAAWLNQVRSALDAASLNNELKIWDEGLTGMQFTDDYRDAGMWSTMASTRGILNGFLEKFSGREPSIELFPSEIVKGTRGYIEQIARQANGCYERGWYDPCAVMLRRLLETLIIECFEKHGVAEKVQDGGGNFVPLSQLVTTFLSESKWHVSRNTKNDLPKLKKLGDLSAHNPRFLAKRQDIDKLAGNIRVVIEELVHIAELN